MAARTVKVAKSSLIREDWDDPHVSPTAHSAEDMLDPRRIERVAVLMAAAIRRQENRTPKGAA